jgi:hypothetical protein
MAVGSNGSLPAGSALEPQEGAISLGFYNPLADASGEPVGALPVCAKAPAVAAGNRSVLWRVLI